MQTLQELDNIQSRLPTPVHSIDIESLMHMHQSSQSSQTELRWHKIAIILTAIIVLLVYFLLRLHFDKLLCAATKTLDTESDTSPQQHRNPEPRQRDGTECFVFKLCIAKCELIQSHWTSIRVNLRVRLQ